jgi:glycosyltransferase involved in cell wall biosynthesis
MKKSMISVVIPCYKIEQGLIQIIENIGDQVDRIYVIDDNCPYKIGELIKNKCSDPRVVVLENSSNLGVGGAVKRGYIKSLEDGMHIIIKLDGDGQMNPKLIPGLIKKIEDGEADYVKGNRFSNLQGLKNMPIMRILGNLGLSFVSKLSTGYWNVFDPTNGFTAIHANALKRLNLTRISDRFFFETDMISNLYNIRAVIKEYPMDAVYGSEKSNLKIHKIIVPFAYLHLKKLINRVIVNYYIRDFNLGSLNLTAGIIFTSFGLAWTVLSWSEFSSKGLNTPAGVVMIGALPIILGINMLLKFLDYDLQRVPSKPVSFE